MGRHTAVPYASALGHVNLYMFHRISTGRSLTKGESPYDNIACVPVSADVRSLEN
jgi:hypothetical protein